MTSREYLELVVSSAKDYLNIHDHGPAEGCRDCQFESARREAAERMLRDEDYTDNLKDTIRVHVDNMMFLLEQEQIVKGVTSR